MGELGIKTQYVKNYIATTKESDFSVVKTINKAKTKRVIKSPFLNYYIIQFNKNYYQFVNFLNFYFFLSKNRLLFFLMI